MNIQDAATIASVLTQYERHFNRNEDAGQTPLAELLELSFPKYQWVWDPKAGRYEVLMDAGEGRRVRGVLEAKEEEQGPAGQMPFSFQVVGGGPIGRARP